MSTLTTKNIEIGFDGKEWIQMIRKKTNRKISIPLLPKAKESLEKYNNELPRISNQKFNAYLKEIGVVVGIQKKMSHHLARRIFAMTVFLFNDVPMEIVSALLGHATMSVTQDSYAKIVNKKIAATMAVFYRGSDG